MDKTATTLSTYLSLPKGRGLRVWYQDEMRDLHYGLAVQEPYILLRKYKIVSHE